MLDNRYLLESVLLIAALGQSPLAFAEAPVPPAEIWLRPLVDRSKIFWIPDQGIVEEMKEAVDIALRSRLQTAAGNARLGGEYWFQYEGRWSGDTKTIFFVGRAGKFPARILKHVNSASFPEDCHIYGTYVPSTKTLTDFSLGGLNCPSRL